MRRTNLFQSTCIPGTAKYAAVYSLIAPDERVSDQCNIALQVRL